MRSGNTVKVAGLRRQSGANPVWPVRVQGRSTALAVHTREIRMLALSRRVVRWCMLKTPHGQKRQTDRRETRTRESAHRAAPAEGRASSGREGPEGDARIGQGGRRSGYCPHQAWATAARRLAARRELERVQRATHSQSPAQPSSTAVVSSDRRSLGPTVRNASTRRMHREPASVDVRFFSSPRSSTAAPRRRWRPGSAGCSRATRAPRSTRSCRRRCDRGARA